MVAVAVRSFDLGQVGNSDLAHMGFDLAPVGLTVLGTLGSFDLVVEGRVGAGVGTLAVKNIAEVGIVELVASFVADIRSVVVGTIEEEHSNLEARLRVEDADSLD